jgi:hypothetical protein
LRAKLKPDETPLEFYASLDEALSEAWEHAWLVWRLSISLWKREFEGFIKTILFSRQRINAVYRAFRLRSMSGIFTLSGVEAFYNVNNNNKMKYPSTLLRQAPQRLLRVTNQLSVRVAQRPSERILPGGKWSVSRTLLDTFLLMSELLEVTLRRHCER